MALPTACTGPWLALTHTCTHTCTRPPAHPPLSTLPSVAAVQLKSGSAGATPLHMHSLGVTGLAHGRGRRGTVGRATGWCGLCMSGHRCFSHEVPGPLPRPSQWTPLSPLHLLPAHEICFAPGPAVRAAIRSPQLLLHSERIVKKILIRLLQRVDGGTAGLNVTHGRSCRHASSQGAADSLALPAQQAWACRKNSGPCCSPTDQPTSRSIGPLKKRCSTARRASSWKSGSHSWKVGGGDRQLLMQHSSGARRPQQQGLLRMPCNPAILVSAAVSGAPP